MEILGMNINININPQALIDWAFSSGIKILVIILVAYFIKKILKVTIERLIRKLVPPDSFLSVQAEKKREDTLIRILSGFSGVVIWLLASIMIVGEFGIAIAPFLATLGIAGVALGFGGQYLIKDIISGLFIIIENQYRIGDVVCFDKTCGSVEDITLRLTTLRDLDGRVHHVPHGEIKITSNLSKGFARVNLDIGVSYNADLEKVIEVVNRVGNELAEDPDFKDSIREAPQFARVNDLADSAVIIKILGETEPLRQWAVTAELRKRLKITFDKEGIEIPFPQVVVHQKK